MPGLNGLIGEVHVLLGVFEQQYVHRQWPIYAVIGSTGIVLGAWYLFTMLKRVFFGPVKEPAHEGHNGPIHDLNLREIMALLPIATLFVVLGVYPQPVLDTSRPDLRVVARIVNE